MTFTDLAAEPFQWSHTVKSIASLLIPILGVALLLPTPDAVAQNSKVERELKKLKIAKKKYEEKRIIEKNKLVDLFDEAIKSVRKSKMAVDIKAKVVADIKESKASFVDDGEFAKIPAFQDGYIEYVVKSKKAYATLMKAYDRALKRLPSGKQQENVESELDGHFEEIRKLDSLKVGKTWVGFRMDNIRGPVFKEVADEYGQYLKLERVRNDKVDVDFTLRIDKRNGENVEGTISQNGGRFVGKVAGSYDGVSLNLAMTRMVRGAERYFEYSGEVVGNYGYLELRGRKTNGVLTTGRILLESDDE